MIARLVLIAALVALAGALVQWRLVGRQHEAPAPETARPGYYLTGVDLEEFGADGRLRIGLQSISATEDPASGVIRLADVAVTYHAAEGRVWRLAANEARVPPGGRLVEFEGDVRLAGRPGEGPEPAELHTARLTLDTEGEIAETRLPVELALGAHRMRAQGMRADLKAGTLRLESEVHGRFTP